MSFRISVFLVGMGLVLELLACGPDDTPPIRKDVPSIVPPVGVTSLQGEEKRPPAPPAKPACEATVDEKGVVKIGEKTTGLVLKPKATGVVFPLDAKRILVTDQHAWTTHEALPAKGQLWALACTAPHGHELFLERKGADFGTAALSVDRRMLFYTTIHGVAALTLGGKEERSVTKPGGVDDTCWQLGSGRARRMIDVVRTVQQDSGALLVERGSFCGLQGSWVSERLLISDPAAPKRGLVKRPHSMTTIAKDARGNVYVGDGGSCDQPGIRARQTPGRVFKSTDRGSSWRSVRVRVKEAAMHSGAHTILADQRRGGNLVVLSALCRMPFGSYGGLLYMTRDGGRTWRKISVSSTAGEEVDGGVGVDAVALVGGSIDRLYVWNKQGHRYRSQNTGKSWEESPSAAGPPKRLQMVKIPGATLTLSSKGLLREAVGGVRQVAHHEAQATKHEMAR